MTENEQKAKLIKDALKIVDKLATLEFEDMDGFIDVQDGLEKLIKRAKELKKSKLWKLN